MASGLALAAASLDSQLDFTWESPSSTQVASTSDGFIAQVRWPQAEHKWKLTLACTTLGIPGLAHPVDSYNHVRAPLPSPAKLILHGGQRLAVSGHGQSLQLTGLGKSLPLTCQQQPRLNYKRRVYSAHRKGAPQLPRLGDRGGCATGPYKTPNTLNHATKTGSHGSPT